MFGDVTESDQIEQDTPPKENGHTWYGIITVTLLIIFVLSRGSDWRGDSQLHTLMEGITTWMAFIVGATAMVRYYSKKDVIYLIVGTGFLGAGLLDGYHALVTSSYIQPFMPSAMVELIPWSWVASRQFLSIMMVLAIFPWLLGAAGTSTWSTAEKRVFGFASLFTVLSFILFALTPLPRAYYPEYIFHRPEEFLPGLLFLIALVGGYRKGTWRRDPFEYWLVASLIVEVVGQSVFMSLSGVLFDIEFDIAHLLKTASYLTVLIGLMISFFSTFQQEQRLSERLEKHYAALEEAAMELADEVAVRKHTEEELQERTVKLTRSNEELERFAFVASHDLQEPLRKIRAFGDRLQSRYADLLEDRGKDYIDRMQSAATRMQRLISDLLSFSKVSSHGNHFVKTDLNELAEQIVSDLETSIHEADAQVTILDLGTHVVDGLQVQQILQNLIGNAIKYRKPDVAPEITVWSENVDLSTESGRPKRFHKITVEDNGIGFDQKYADKIFEVFSRLHGREDYDGTGIGLSVVRKIAERHDGYVEVESAEGKGTKFMVYLNRDLQVQPEE